MEPHWARLRALLDHGGNEAAAYLLLGHADIGVDPWSGEPRLRLVSHEHRDIPEADRVSASPRHVTWSTSGYMRLLSDAAARDLVPAVVHTHPNGRAFFSEQDDANEAELARTARNKRLRGLASVVLGGDGSVVARFWMPDGSTRDAAWVQVVGHRLSRWGSVQPQDGGAEHLDRQARLFGPAFNTTVGSLRVAVVGAGGTGSPVAMLLARLGVGRLLLVDRDVVEVTNLNRVHGSRRSDAEARLPKVDILEREIDLAGLGVQVRTRRAWVNEPGVRDSLRACDVVFSCTDDHAGRALLNRLAYHYGIPVIDVGLRMVRRPSGGHDVNGRVTTLVPGHPCLLCGSFIDPRRAAEEALERANPAEFARRKAEAYVLGSGDPAPAVVTFTTEMACVAVNEMVAMLTGFHGEDGMIATRYRRFHLRDDRFLAATSRPGCPVCDTGEAWGRGDVEPFLGMIA
nr:ThiF family adenylyltransferase [Roseomonas acroporae]